MRSHGQSHSRQSRTADALENAANLIEDSVSRLLIKFEIRLEIECCRMFKRVHFDLSIADLIDYSNDNDGAAYFVKIRGSTAQIERSIVVA